MKKTSTAITLINLSLTTLIWAEKPQVTNNPVQIVCISKKAGENIAAHQTMKENTLYWWNDADDIRLGPKIEEENGYKFLRMQGHEQDGGDKNKCYLDLTQIFPIPAVTSQTPVANKAKLIFTLRWNQIIEETPEIKEKADVTATSNEINPPNLSHFLYTFGAGEKQVLNTNLGKLEGNTGIFTQSNKNKWVEYAETINIPSGTKFIRIHIKTDNSTIIDVANLTVTF